jgi:serine/threonine protein kinase
MAQLETSSNFDRGILVSRGFVGFTFHDETLRVPGRTGLFKLKRERRWETIMGKDKVEIEIYKMTPDNFVSGDLFKSLDHKNVAKVIGAYFDNDDQARPEPLLILDAPEMSLDKRIQEVARLSQFEQVNFFHQASDGIKYLHDKSIIHCSISLQSITVKQREQAYSVKLKNFWRCCKLEENCESVRRVLRPWVLSECFSHVSPPEAKQGEISKKIDIYSLGLAMLEAASPGMRRWNRNPHRLANGLHDYHPLKKAIIHCLEADLSARASSADIYNEIDQVHMQLSIQLSLEARSVVPLTVTRILFIGPPAVGKSSLKHALVNNQPKRVKESSPVLESPDTVRVTADQYRVNSSPKDSSQSLWEVVHERGIVTSIQDATQKNFSKLHTDFDAREKQLCSSMPNQSEYTNPSSRVQGHGNCLRTSESMKSTISSRNHSDTILGGNEPNLDDTETMSNLNIALEELRKKYHNEQPDFSMDNTHLIHILDTGGQACFHDVLSIFLDVPCLYVLVFKASSVDSEDKFEKEANITYRYTRESDPLVSGRTSSAAVAGSEQENIHGLYNGSMLKSQQTHPEFKSTITVTEQDLVKKVSDSNMQECMTQSGKVKMSAGSVVEVNSTQIPAIVTESLCRNKTTQRNELGSQGHVNVKGEPKQISGAESPGRHTTVVPHFKLQTDADEDDCQISQKADFQVEGHKEQTALTKDHMEKTAGTGDRMKETTTKAVHIKETTGPGTDCQMEDTNEKEGHRGQSMVMDIPHVLKREGNLERLSGGVEERSSYGNSESESPQSIEGFDHFLPDHLIEGKATASKLPTDTVMPMTNSKDEIVCKTIFSDQTEMQILHRICSTVHIMQKKNFEGLSAVINVTKRPEPKLCIIGTFKDEISDLEKAKSEINEVVKQFLKSRNLVHIIIKDGNSPFFLLNSVESMEDSEHSSYIQKLRESLSSSTSAMQMEVPVMWYHLQQAAKRVTPSFLRYEVLRKCAIENDFFSHEDKQQFDCFLKVFHLLGLFVYFEIPGSPEEHNYICTDATVFYEQVSRLVTVQFKDDSDLSSETHQFKENGIIEFYPYKPRTSQSEVFKDLGIEPAMDKVWFFDVLSHLGIAGQIDSTLNNDSLEKHERSVTYFIPIALPERRCTSRSDTVTVTATAPTASVSTLCITYAMQRSRASSMHCILPQGTYAQLAVKLLEKKWELIPQKNTRGSIKFLYSNSQIRITEAANWLEVDVWFQKPFSRLHTPVNHVLDKMHRFCSHILETIQKTIEIICKKRFPRLVKEAKISRGFHCPCPEVFRHITNVRHADEAEEADISMVCIGGKMADQFQSLSLDQHLWFTKIPKEDLPHVEIVLDSCGEETPMDFWKVTKKQSEPDGLPVIPIAGTVYDTTLTKVLPTMRTKISLDDLLPRLEEPAGGFMTEAEKNEVQAERVKQTMVDKIIEILKRKDTNAFYKFMEILNLSGNSMWASVLQDSIEQPLAGKSSTDSVHTPSYYASSMDHPKRYFVFTAMQAIANTLEQCTVKVLVVYLLLGST